MPNDAARFLSVAYSALQRRSGIFPLRLILGTPLLYSIRLDHVRRSGQSDPPTISQQEIENAQV